jgi:hypothetical protein
MITSSNIKIHLLTRKKVCSFFIWLGVSVLTVITAYSPEKWKEIIDKVNE